MGNQFKLLKTLVKQGKVGVLCIHTILAKKHDIWLEGCCFLATYFCCCGSLSKNKHLFIAKIVKVNFNSVPG